MDCETRVFLILFVISTLLFCGWLVYTALTRDRGISARIEQIPRNGMLARFMYPEGVLGTDTNEVDTGKAEQLLEPFKCLTESKPGRQYETCEDIGVRPSEIPGGLFSEVDECFCDLFYGLCYYLEAVVDYMIDQKPEYRREALRKVKYEIVSILVINIMFRKGIAGMQENVFETPIIELLKTLITDITVSQYGMITFKEYSADLPRNILGINTFLLTKEYRLKHIPVTALSFFPQMRIVSLGNGELTDADIPEIESLRELPKLEVLILSGNKLETFPCFGDFPSLQIVRLCSNKLKSVRVDNYIIPGTRGYKKCKIWSISLTKNSITDLDYRIFDIMPIEKIAISEEFIDEIKRQHPGNKNNKKIVASN